jgi:hypothetical protein
VLASSTLKDDGGDDRHVFPLVSILVVNYFAPMCFSPDMFNVYDKEVKNIFDFDIKCRYI